jgi:hypothetical protein
MGQCIVISVSASLKVYRNIYKLTFIDYLENELATEVGDTAAKLLRLNDD